MRRQHCPLDHLDARDEPIPCGDWCPLFCEPAHDELTRMGKTDNVVLQLCKRTLIFDSDFTDERGNE
ncbi:MAG: hypothetical protein GY771_08910 [bacterium]|nr:hypothetical protein [bacterium]